jgi:hypothetical protein
MYKFVVSTKKKKYKRLDGYSCNGSNRYSVLNHLVQKFARKEVDANGKVWYWSYYSFDELKTALFRGYISIDYDLNNLLRKE